jgi:hypothetical protein
MKKHLLSIFVLFAGLQASAQYDYAPNGRNDAPLLGMEWGLTGGGFTSMLTNRDDIDADKRLDPQMMNFSYAAGVEGIYWFQKTVGFGGQLLYWNGGAAYKGLDTITKLSLDAQTSMTYLKLPLMFHFKSFNRYYPNRRTRFSAMFGPYVALLQSYSDKLTITNEDNTYKSEVSYDNTSYTANVNGGSTPTKGSINGKIYKPFDVGFVFGVGGEVRLWKRTVVALHIRTDLGFSDVEDKRKRKFKLDGQTAETDIDPWGGLYAKYTPPNALDNLAGFQANRPASKNFSVGAFLSLRKYFRQ